MTGARSPTLARATASVTGISVLRKRLRMAQARSEISLANAWASPRSLRAVTTVAMPFFGVSENTKPPKMETLRMAPECSA